MIDDTMIIPIDKGDTLDSFAALSVQVDALRRSAEGDLTGIYTTRGYREPFPFDGDSISLHVWEDAIYIAALKAISAGAEHPEIWATIALRVHATEFTRRYE